MKPLLFLTLRTFANGVKRALTSGKRLISLIVFASYYFFIVMRPIEGGRRQEVPRDLAGRLAFPPLEVLDAVVFAGFSVLTVILALGIFSYRASFKPADVDVLFATPVSPRLVLVFRIARDYLLTLLMPLLLVLVGWRGSSLGFEALFQTFPRHGGHVVRAGLAAWLLMALTWVAIGYAASLFVNRSDLDSDRNRKILTWSLALVILGTAAYITTTLMNAESWETALRLAQAPLLRTVFFTATAATALVMAPLEGSLWLAVLGGGSMALIIVSCMGLALTQVDWMYDQAAARGFESQQSRAMQQKGDTYGLLAEQARRGKLKAGRQRWLHRLNARGWKALVWKEAIIQMRGAIWVIVLLGVMVLGMSVLPLFFDSGRRDRNIGWVFLAMQALGAFMMSMNSAQSGYIELLRRVDLQKPLPFTSAKTVLAEVAAKAAPTILAGWATGAVVLVLRADLWQFVIASAIAMPGIVILICSTVLMVTLLFPDVDDPTQRGFRGLMMMLGIALLGLPGGGLFILLTYLMGPALAALPTLGLNVLITVGLAAVCGGLYAAYNPSE